MASSPSDAVFDEIVNTLYTAVLRRAPDEGGRAAYLQLLRDGRSEFDLIKLLIRSKEFNESVLMPASERLLVKFDEYDPDNDEEVTRYATADVKQLAARVRQASIPKAAFDDAVDQAIKITGGYLNSQIEYLNLHKRRFYEIDQAVKNVTSAKSKELKILDFGLSINSFILRSLFPNIKLSVGDRPQIRLPEVKFDGTYIVDLADDRLNETDWGDRFDLIIFSEVLEHVLVHPSKIIDFLLRHLKEDGEVILTTPNLFSRSKMRRISKRKNPLELFPASYIRADAPHFHVREYCMSEILSIIEACGGSIRTFFSLNAGMIRTWQT